MSLVRKLFWLMALSAILALAGTGCGGDDDDDSGGDDTGDDDTGDDDVSDDDTGDDDTMDDDTGDDDTTDDDTGDDDTGDDDTGDDDTSDDDTGDDDTGDDDTQVLYDIDFEDYTDGPLGSPWTVTLSGATTLSTGDLVLDEGSGKVLYQDGGTQPEGADYIMAQYNFTETAQDVWVSFDVKVADSGTDWGFRTVVEYYGYTYSQTQLVVHDGALTALDFYTGSTTNCGTMSVSTWDNVAILYDYSSGNYSVELNGSSTPCANLVSVAAQYPAFGLQVIDWSDDGYGGVADFDSFHGEIDGGADIFDVDFESGYSDGPLGSPWTIVGQDGTSSANIVTLTSADGSGKILQIDGGTTVTLPDYAIAYYQFAQTARNWDSYFDVYIPDAASAFGFRTIQNTASGSSVGAQLVYYNGLLQAYDGFPGSYVTCTYLSEDTWYNIKIEHHYAQRTFSVLVDDTATTCNNLNTQGFIVNGPYLLFQVIDWSDENYGGQIIWDNFYGESHS